jgi:(2Fe-2S) ferredoxin
MQAERPCLGALDHAPGGLVCATDGTWYREYRPEVVAAVRRAETDRWIVEQSISHRVLGAESEMTRRVRAYLRGGTA